MSRKRQDRSQPKSFSGFKPIRLTARSEGQRAYIKSILDSDVTLCLGPPGSGKTHIAAGLAVQLLRDSDITKIILCRPVVSCGKDIGYLPGTMQEKVGPYLTPLFDELSHYLELNLIKQLLGDLVIEIVPLSMMRGRTFNNAIVILDEAQNATPIELKTLLTRLGFNTKIIVTGDPRQSDLPLHQQGAFQHVADTVRHLTGVSVVLLQAEDIVRHKLVGDFERLL